jgi:phosphoenolpyruvate-protein kinase (PTS system EI component)
MAADRTLTEVAALYQPDHPAVLELVGRVCAAAERAGRWVGVCGEMAADPDLATVLVGLGVRELSMAPAAIPTVKQHLRMITLAEAAAARGA